MNEELERTSVH